ncbi:hypothetical protein K505DRAFT_369538 [Melanomma pulvis-pyrius CBS 109.77]|uniref:Uncharacterized protein n=1 Tax=Melanomma pulvis-pyrius CBS 109.77 TaxID=1314802 RepID=A0A6A6WMX0_9PLEO|nr:hypothetical protein K505DRAFT_369538 [Melanomma pulvis-pyrius CBS 109.77]
MRQRQLYTPSPLPFTTFHCQRLYPVLHRLEDPSHLPDGNGNGKGNDDDDGIHPSKLPSSLGVSLGMRQRQLYIPSPLPFTLPTLSTALHRLEDPSHLPDGNGKGNDDDDGIHPFKLPSTARG